MSLFSKITPLSMVEYPDIVTEKITDLQLANYILAYEQDKKYEYALTGMKLVRYVFLLQYYFMKETGKKLCETNICFDWHEKYKDDGETETLIPSVYNNFWDINIQEESKPKTRKSFSYESILKNDKLKDFIDSKLNDIRILHPWQLVNLVNDITENLSYSEKRLITN